MLVRKKTLKSLYTVSFISVITSNTRIKHGITAKILAYLVNLIVIYVIGLKVIYPILEKLNNNFYFFLFKLIFIFNFL